MSSELLPQSKTIGDGVEVTVDHLYGLVSVPGSTGLKQKKYKMSHFFSDFHSESEYFVLDICLTFSCPNILDWLWVQEHLHFQGHNFFLPEPINRLNPLEAARGGGRDETAGAETGCEAGKGAGVGTVGADETVRHSKDALGLV